MRELPNAGDNFLTDQDANVVDHVATSPRGPQTGTHGVHRSISFGKLYRFSGGEKRIPQVVETR